ncbi:Cna B-type domain-containing protein [Lapidilactobacillus dextrinicus]|uniref:Cna B-type domain-containing protein n=1 Tax=Lapidilactobacillus dextrinicus TaxID=51664 RepID=UPI00124ADB00|nr:Cna B-type domain-containing protein [Lapidilactobacillus dextrinicus]QFG47507.1 Cna B-type domain-containing protein [Lapidilactobacillus dextrinicus]
MSIFSSTGTVLADTIVNSNTITKQSQSASASSANQTVTSTTSQSAVSSSSALSSIVEEQSAATTSSANSGTSQVSAANSSSTQTDTNTKEQARAPSTRKEITDGITGTQLLDKNGDPITNGTTIGMYDPLTAEWEFSIDPSSVDAGDTMTVNIPNALNDALHLTNGTEFDVKDKAGNVIGHAVAKDGKVTITFSDYVDQTTNPITGNFNVSLSWDTSQITGKQEVPVTWENGSQTIVTVDPGNGPSTDEKLYKWGWYDSQDPSIIHWRVRVNYARTQINNAVYTDTLGANQTLVSGSVSAVHVVYNADGSTYTQGAVYPSSAVTESDSGFTVNLGDINDTIIIDYQTKITDGGAAGTYANSGKLTGTNIDDVTVDVYSPSFTGSGTGATTTNVIGTKTWDDQDNQDGSRPASVTVHLYANDVDTGKYAVVNADANWKYSFNDLAIYDDNGAAIIYSVVEDPVGGYESEINGYNITNKYTPETTSVKGTKTWSDQDNKYNTRPSTITVDLLADGEVVDSKEVTVDADGNWNYEFTGLPKNKDGKEITYTVKEEKVNGYTSTVDGNNIKNTLETTSIKGTKTWDDKDNQDGKRPTSITVSVYNGDEKVASKEVTADADGNWNYEFTDLPKLDSKGNEIKYTVKEENVADGYTSTVDGNNIKNTLETTSIKGTKTWDDKDNQDGKRPTSIKINLLANGKVVATKEVTAEENWQYSFTDLPKYADGQEIVYTVSEDAVPDYSTTINGFDITNSYTPGATSITGTKTWDDKDNQDGLRPSSIKVNLLANGKVIATKEVTAKENWQYSFTNLPEYENGKKITYTVEEEKVEGYETVVNGTNITNKHTPATTSITGTKTWDDNNNAGHTRPTSITVELYSDGIKTETTKADESTGWKYSFTNLPKYNNGKEIVYMTKEISVDGYTTTQNGYDFTNTLITKTPVVPVLPITPSTPDKPTITDNTKPKDEGSIISTINKKLPQTGEARNTLALVGILLLMMVLAVLVWHHRSVKEG